MRFSVLVSVLAAVTLQIEAAEVYAPRIDFRPSFEADGGELKAALAGPNGTCYLVGDFSGAGPVPHAMIARLLPDGSADSSFVPAPITGGVVNTAAFQMDGKILIGGSFYQVGGLIRSRIARLLVDGSVDASLDPGTGINGVNHVLVQPDGRILVAGGFDQIGGQYRRHIIRLNADGTLDPSFTPALNVNAGIGSVILNSQGKLFVAGQDLALIANESRQVVRLNADGSLDESFVAPAFSISSAATDVALLADGRVLVAGSFYTSGVAAPEFFLRLNADGARDETLPASAVFNHYVSSMSVGGDGKILVAGSFGAFGAEPRLNLAVFNTDGSLDPTFVPGATNNGWSTAARLANGTVIGGLYSNLNRMAADGTPDVSFPGRTRTPGTVGVVEPLPDGRWFVAGTFSWVNGEARNNLAIMQADGTLDASFLPGSGFTGNVSSATMDDAGRMLIAGGCAYTQGSDYRYGVFRLLGDGSLDPAFSLPGNVISQSMVVRYHQEGKVLIGNLRRAFEDENPPLLRLNDDGTADSTFGPVGINGISEMLVEEDAKIVVVGSFAAMDAETVNRIVRLNPDGTRDATFNSGTGFDGDVYSFVRHPDGGFLAGGRFGSYNGSPRLFAAKLMSDGAVDPGFVPEMPYNSHVIYEIAATADGNVWATGMFYIDSFLRIQPSGATLAQPDYLGSGFNGITLLRTMPEGQLLVAGTWEAGAITGRGMAILEKVSPPRIVLQPTVGSVVAGDDVNLTVQAAGVNLSYLWLKDGVVVPGASESTLTLSNVMPADSGNYQVRISDDFGSTTSLPVVVRGSALPPEITQQSPRTAAREGGVATLSVTATGTGPLSYRWRRGGHDIAGATGPQLALDPVTFADAGVYEVVVGDGMSTTRSHPIRVDVFPAVVADVYTAAPFGPRLEKHGGMIRTLAPGAGGKYYVAGDFSGAGAATTVRVARFHGNGSVDTSFTPAMIHDGVVFGLTEQSDGRLVLVGTFSQVAAVARDCVARLNADGSVDAGFSTRGGFGPRFGLDPFVRAVIVQPDGRIVIGGEFGSYDGTARTAIARLLADGAFDPGFVPSSTVNGPVYALALQADGHVIAGGIFEDETTSIRRCLIRLRPDGSAETDFTAGASFSAPVFALATQLDGRVLVGYNALQFGHGTEQAEGIARLNVNGTLDTSFAPATAPDSAVEAIVVVADGTILAGGAMFIDGQTTRARLVRLTNTGALSAVLHAVSESNYDQTQIASVLSLADGSTLAVHDGGGVYPTNLAEVRHTELWRFDAGGQRDPTFACVTREAGNMHVIAGIGEGRWAVGGNFNFVDGSPQGGLAVLRSDGTLDPTFAIGIGFAGPVWAIDVDVVGRLVVGGSFATYQGSAAENLVRLNQDGSLDAAFDPQHTLLAKGDTRSLIVLPDGRILASGGAVSVQEVERYGVVQFSHDGAMDEGFDGRGGDVTQVSLQPDGRILVSRTFHYSTNGPAFGLLRLFADGTVDPSLAPNVGGVRSGYSTISDDSGRAFVGLQGQVWRFDPSGAFDSDYQSKAWVPFHEVRSMALYPDGSMVCVGSPTNDPASTIARLLPDGAPSPAFAVFWEETRPVAPTSAINDVAPGPMGTILLAPEAFGDGRLVVLEPAAIPRIVGQPVEQRALPGGAVTFSVAATGEGLHFQWFKDGFAISGATASSLQLSNVHLADVARYAAEVSSIYGSVTSDRVLLTGLNPFPVVTTQPSSIDVCAGQTATLQVAATGTGSLAYQWRKAGLPMPGRTKATLELTAVEMADAGFYDVVINDGLSITLSAAVEVRVAPPAYPNVLRARASFIPRLETAGGVMHALLVVPDGKLVVGGSFARVGVSPWLNLARLNADGSPDPSFAPPPLAGTAVYALARQLDGRLLVGGDFTVTGPDDAVHQNVVRLHEDGSIDTSFHIAGPFSAPVRAIAALADGRVVVGGSFFVIGETYAPRLARFATDGVQDTAFASSTIASGTVYALAERNDGTLLVGGEFFAQTSFQQNLVALTAAGTIDPGFYPGQSYFFSGPSGRVFAVRVLPDGRIIVGGAFSSVSVGGESTLADGIARLTANGEVDAVYRAATTDGWGMDVVVDDVGRLLVSRYSTVFDGGATTVLTSVIRLNSDLTVDVGFGPKAANNVINRVAVAPDGRIYAGGSFSAVDAVPMGGLARFLDTGGIDPVWESEFHSLGFASAIVPLPAGTWLVVGRFDSVDGVPTGNIVQLRTDGAIDGAFNPGSGFDGEVHGLVRQGDGRVLAWGAFTTFNGETVGVLPRLETNGLRDATFALELPPTLVVSSVAIQPTGGILLSGESSVGTRVWRVRPDGQVDPAFGDSLALVLAPRVMLPRRDGTTWLARALTGYSAGPESRAIGLLDVEGKLDPAYIPAITSSQEITALAEQPDGRLLVGGSFRSGVPLAYDNLVRLQPAGAADTGFGQDVNVAMFPSQIVVQHDGDILTAGQSSIANGVATPAISRFNVDGSSDAGFVIQGVNQPAAIRAVAYTNNGALLVAGLPMNLGGVSSFGLTLLEPTPEPVITGQPAVPTPTVAGGAGVVLTVGASGNGDVHFQWQMQSAGAGSNGALSFGAQDADDGWADVPGATSATLAIPVPQRFHNGVYRVVIAANGTSTTSDPVTVEVGAAVTSPDARLLNLSTRAQALTGDDVLIPGFVIAGTGNKRLLIRAVGPTLGKVPFNLAGTLADPRLRLLKRNPMTQAFEEIAANDNWGTNANVAAITQTAADVFAFAFNDDREAALLLDLAPGEYTAIASGTNPSTGSGQAATGIAIVELYDADTSGAGPRLINISNRGFAGVGDQVMIPGFVVSSEGPKTVLIRVVGPTLGAFGVAGTMADPKLEVFPGGASSPILTNDNWANNPDAAYTAQIASQVSAFPLTTGSKDAAFVVTLPPGSYTVVGSSAVAGGFGVVLVEVYAVQ